MDCRCLVFFVAIVAEHLLLGIEKYNFLVWRPHSPTVRCCEASPGLWFWLRYFPRWLFFLSFWYLDCAFGLLSLHWFQLPKMVRFFLKLKSLLLVKFLPLSRLWQKQPFPSWLPTLTIPAVVLLMPLPKWWNTQRVLISCWLLHGIQYSMSCSRNRTDWLYKWIGSSG